MRVMKMDKNKDNILMCFVIVSWTSQIVKWCPRVKVFCVLFANTFIIVIFQHLPKVINGFG